MTTATTLSQVLLVLIGIVFMGVTYRVYRSRDKPIEASFAVLSGLLGATALCIGITAATGTIGLLIWLHTNLAIPLALVYFSLDYYGIDVLSNRLRLAALAAPTMLGSIGGSYLILGQPDPETGTAAIQLFADAPEAVFSFASAFDQVGYLYTIGLVIAAVGLVSINVYRYEHLDNRLAIAIAFIGAWPWFGNFVVPEVVTYASHETAMILMAGGYSLGLVGTLLVVGPLGLFGSTPAAGNVGSERVLDSMDDAVVMLDEYGQVLRLNDCAVRTFDRTESAAVGKPFEELTGYELSALPANEPLSIETTDGIRQFELARSPVSDRWGDQRGEVLVLRDVTNRLTREQRLQVLNRVLRHNLRNNASNIIARAELIKEQDAPSETESASKIIDSTKTLVGTAERAREIERMMDAGGQREQTTLSWIIDRITDDISQDYPAVEVTTALPEGASIDANATVLEVVLKNLVENAAEHNDADQPIVVISADRRQDGSFRISIADNGPGIPEFERKVIETGREDQLDHGSGLGLWAAHWGTMQLGGTLSISDNDPRGSIVSITVPPRDHSAAIQQPAEATP